MAGNYECVYSDLPKAKELLPIGIIKMASGLFAKSTGLSGQQIFDFFGRYSDEIGKMRYGSGAPSRWKMFENFLESLPIEKQRAALLELCDGFPTGNPPPQEEVEKLREKIWGVPVPATLGPAVERIDVGYVTKQWEKLSERLAEDPEGAITSARTLLESVCLPDPSPLELVATICERFQLVVRQLRERHAKRVTLEIHDEYDVQDLMHALLRLHFDDVREEEWTPSYAGGAARMDFLLKEEEIVIEAKMTRSKRGTKEIADELIIDAARYKEHKDCKTLVCFVYDPDGVIKNPRGLERDLAKLSDSRVRVLAFISS
jgi:hypothetical protein